MFQKTTIDVLLISTLGIDPGSLTSADAPFHELYQQILNPSAINHLLTFINGHINVRDWLPLAENRKWLHANAEIRRLLLDCVRKRLAEMDNDEKARLSSRDARDLLTFIIEEQPLSDQQDQWSDLQILDHVSG
jgi:hypothetical protein